MHRNQDNRHVKYFDIKKKNKKIDLFMVLYI